MNGETTQFEQFAQTFMDSCLAVWDGTATGIAPEAWTWNPESLISEKKAVKDSGLLNFIKDIITQTKKDTNDQRPFQITSPIYNLRPGTCLLCIALSCSFHNFALQKRSRASSTSIELQATPNIR